MWIQFARHVTFAVLAGVVGLTAVQDAGGVPAPFMPFLVAGVTAFVNSVILAAATAAALGGRHPVLAWRGALAVWWVGIAGTLVALVLALVDESEGETPLAALFAVPFLVMAKPPRWMRPERGSPRLPPP
ncbi:hypothetical protein GCM10022254_68430 [Actinomadura meridiana]|uniref:Integral membrane protein n=2 Tax=Actinomadura meridiana TaxID=559626 RepID=A0ABP8CMB4_9ACTN